MRISDWSSDVCSSDLLHQPRSIRAIDGTVIEASGGAHDGCDLQGVVDHIGAFFACADRHNHALGRIDDRIELLDPEHRSAEHTSELQSLMRISYAVFCLKKKKHKKQQIQRNTTRRIHEYTNKNRTQTI